MDHMWKKKKWISILLQSCKWLNMFTDVFFKPIVNELSNTNYFQENKFFVFFYAV